MICDSTAGGYLAVSYTHLTAGTNRNLDDCRVGVRGVLLIAKYDVDRHGLDVENLERLADLLIHMRTQRDVYKRQLQA